MNEQRTKQGSLTSSPFMSLPSSSSSSLRVWELPADQSSVSQALSSLRPSTRPSLPLGPTQVRVKVEALGLNFFDLLQLTGKYQVKLKAPFVPVRPHLNSLTFALFIV